MDKLFLIDTNNTFRAFAEKCSTGMPIRGYFDQAFFSTEQELYIFDGEYALNRRRAICPIYKVGRQQASDNFYLHLDIMREMLIHSGKMVLRIPGWEADDVINYVARTWEGPVVIDSTDKDFLALADERVSVPKAKLENVDKHDVPLYKTLVGDKSDKIPGIVGFGDKMWFDLTPEHKLKWLMVLRGDIDLNLIDIPSELGVKAGKLADKVEEGIATLRSYYQVVSFFDLPPDLFGKHLKVGVKNYPLANKLMAEIYQ